MHIAGLSLLKSIKEKGFLLVMMAAALVFAGVFGVAFRSASGPSRIPLAVADHDNSPLSRDIIAALESSEAYKVWTVTEEEIRSQVREGKLEVGFVIPSGFQESLSGPNPLGIGAISISGSKLAMATGAAIEKTVSEYVLAMAVKEVTSVTADSLGIGGRVSAEVAAQEVSAQLRDNPAVSLAYQAVSRQVNNTEALESTKHAALGVFIMFTMFTVVFQAGDILQERQDGTWARLLTMPISRQGILAGKILGAYAIGLLQMAVLLVASRYLFGMDYGPNPAAVFVILAVFLFCVTGLGIFLSTLVRTHAQLESLGPLVIVSTCMLGGCYWPLELVPDVIQLIGKLTPQAWAMMGLKEVISRGGGLSSAFGSLAAIGGFALVFFVLGASRVKFE
jgi:ABC-2 type transport system permease protein